jgi:hypothetical protein
MEEITPHLNQAWNAASGFTEPLIGLMDTPQWGYSLFDAGSWAYSVSNTCTITESSVQKIRFAMYHFANAFFCKNRAGNVFIAMQASTV